MVKILLPRNGCIVETGNIAYPMLKKFYKQSLHRELLDDEIGRMSSRIKGKVLDAGSKNRRYDGFLLNAREIIAIDKNPVPNKGIMKADILQLPFEASAFDVVVSFEVLEYIIETKIALSEINRVLKSGGLFVFSVPFLDPVHGDIDAVRYTHDGWRKYLQDDFADIEIRPLGGRFSVVWDFYFEKVRNQYNNRLKWLLMPFLWLSKLAAKRLDEREKTDRCPIRYPMGYFIACKTKKK